MGVPINAVITRTSPTDTYGIHDEQLFIGSYRSVADSTERDAIDVSMRTEGMCVKTLDTGDVHELQSDLTTWVTPPLGFGGAAGGSLILNGDASGAGAVPGTITLTLASVVAPSTKGTAARTITATVNAKGLITAFADQLISITEAQVINLVSDLAAKISSTEKGANNGVATLDAGGHIPAGQLNLSLLNLINTWSAGTNTPALADGVGTVGDGYMVTVGGTQNLGSGNQTFAVGDAVIYFGSLTWLKVSTTFTGIQQIVTASGTLVGASVTLNSTLQINDATNRRYQTDLQKAIQDAAVTAGATAVNRYALLSELSGGITVTNEWNTPETYEDGLNSLGEGTISTQMMNTLTNPITGVAYTTASMLAAYTFLPPTATASTWTYADVCVETAFRRMELAFGSAAITFHDNRIYQYNQSHAKPGVSQWSSFFKPDSWVFQGNSSRHFNISGIAQPIWYRIPPNQSVAFGGSNAWTGYKTLMYNLSMYGANLGVRGNGDTCLIDSATYGSIYQGCVFSSADIGAQFYGCLHGQIIGGSCGGNSRSGIKITTGAGDGIEAPRWTGASLTNSASNGFSVSMANINCANGAFAGVEAYGSDQVTVAGSNKPMAFEGTGGTQSDHHVFIDGQMSQLVKTCTVEQLHLEQTARVSHICIKDYGQVITAYINRISPFLTGTPVLIEARTNPAGSGTVQILVEKLPNLDTGWKFRQIGGGSSGRWTASMCQLFDENNFYNPLNWSQTTIDGLVGVIPNSINATQFAQIIAKTN